MTICEGLEYTQEHCRKHTMSDGYGRLLLGGWSSVSDRLVAGDQRGNAFLQAIESDHLDQLDNPTLDEMAQRIVRE